MRLFVHHYHLRPGGVRRVIELELPALARRGRVEGLVLLSGEPAPDRWFETLRSLVDVPCELRVAPALGYAVERLPARTERGARLDRLLRGLLADATRGDVLWLHNPWIGRNHAAVAGLGRLAARLGLRVVFHHHDFWMDQRWHRWRDLRLTGVRSLRHAAQDMVPTRIPVLHLAINRRDAAILRRHDGGATAWLPDPVVPPAALSRPARDAASRWLHDALGTNRPVWLVPTRLLRRKNVAEALLLMRWLAPEAVLATTGGPSSAGERPCAEALLQHARTHDWPLRIGLLAGRASHPPLADLQRVADTIAFTSIQEGFGLPYVEAAFARRPFLCRLLPHVTDDLARLGLTFPGGYDDVQIPLELFDSAREVRRQRERHARWVRGLPRGVVPPDPPALAGPTVAFSRLTLAAQLDVLALPPAVSWAACRDRNPAIARLHERGGPSAPRAPAAFGERWSPDALAATWWRALRRARPVATADAGGRLQAGLIRSFLAPQHLHPLLWSEQP